MKLLVIYDSVYGNTEKIAEAIAGATESDVEATTLRVNEAKIDQMKEVELLFVGSPTQAFRPTKNISTFLNNIPRDGLRNVNVVAFDTRSDLKDVKSSVFNAMAGWFGYAAKPIADKLTKKGGKLLAQPEGFYVIGREGPLKDGELERAVAWVKAIIKKM